jgi:hypothetical protein
VGRGGAGHAAPGHAGAYPGGHTGANWRVDCQLVASGSTPSRWSPPSARLSRRSRGAASALPGCWGPSAGWLGCRETPPGRQLWVIENICCWSDWCRYIYPYTHTMFSDIYLPPIVPTRQRPLTGPAPRPMPPRCPQAPSPARTRPPCPRGSPNRHSPTGQLSCRVTPNTRWSTGESPVCRVTPNTRWPTGQSPVCRATPNTRWSTGQLSPPFVRPSPFPSAAPARRRRRRPTRQGHPANWLALPPPAGAPPEGEPLWHHRATRGLPGVGCPPGARSSTTPRGQALRIMGPPRHRHAAAEPLP